MKRHNDQYLFDFAFALLDHRSEGFGKKWPNTSSQPAESYGLM